MVSEVEVPVQAVVSAVEVPVQGAIDPGAEEKKASLAAARARVADEAKKWSATNLGEKFELQPKARARGSGHVGEHLASEAGMAGVLAESVVKEDAMAILGAASEAEDGSKLVKLVYMSTGLAVRLARTPRCVAPDADDFLKGHSVDKLAPDVDGLRVAVAQHVPMYM